MELRVHQRAHVGGPGGEHYYALDTESNIEHGVLDTVVGESYRGVHPEVRDLHPPDLAAESENLYFHVGGVVLGGCGLHIEPELLESQGLEHLAGQ